MDDLYLQDLDSTVTGASGEITNQIPPIDLIYNSSPVEVIDIPGEQNIEPGDIPIQVVIADDFSSSIGNSNLAHGDYVAATLVHEYSQINSSEDDGTLEFYFLDIAPENIVEVAFQRLEYFISNSSAEYIVLNMSWVILSCQGEIAVTIGDEVIVITLNLPEILSELKETPKSLLTYVIENYEEFSSEDSLAIRAALANYIAESIDVENDLMDLLDNTENVISIAAAGNFNNEDPEEFPFELIDANNNDVRDAFAPAAWESVLAVSGSLGDNPNAFWSASNDGQVQAPAAWIHFDTPSDLGSYGSGTSFATPLVTAHVVNAIQNNCSQVFTLWQLFVGDNLYFKNAINSRCP